MSGHCATRLGSSPAVLVTAFSALPLLFLGFLQILQDPNSYQNLGLREHISLGRVREKTQTLMPY